MKKSFSLVLAIAMVFSMFSSLAYANEQQSAGEYLKSLGVIEGNLSGDLEEDQTWERQNVTVILSRLMNAEAEASATTKAHTFGDVADPFYDGYITWAKEEGLFQGHSDVRFGYDEEISTYDFLAVMLRALGYDTKGANYENVDELAVSLGLAQAGADLNQAAKKGDLYNVVLDTLHTETADGVVLGQKLELEGFEPVVVNADLDSAAATGAKKIDVAFTAPVQDTDATSFTLKKGVVNVAVDSVSFNEEKTVATITAASKFTQGTYTVTISGIDTLTENTADVTVANEMVGSIELTGDVLPISAAAELGFVVKNQYGEEMDVNPQSYTWVYSSALVADANTTEKAQVNLTNTGIKVDDKITVTVVSSNGKQASKVYTVGKAAELTTLSLLEVKNDDEDAVRLTSGDTATVTFEAKDQYGNAIKKYEMLKDVALVSSSANVTFAWQDVDGGTSDSKDAKLVATVAGGLTADATVVLTAVPGNGQTASLTFQIFKSAAVDSVTISAPEGVVADGDTDVKLPISLLDQYGEAIKLADVTLGAGQDIQTYVASTSVALGAITKVADKEELNIASVTGTGSVTITVVTKAGKSANITLDVQAERYAAAVAFKDLGATKLLQEATTTTKLSFTDQYGTAFKKDDAANKVNIELTKVSGDTGAVTSSVYGDVNDETAVGTITLTAAAAKEGTYKLTVSVVTYDSNETKIASINQNFVVTDGKDEDALTYTLSTIPTLSSKGEYENTIKLTAVDADGNAVAIPDSSITNVLSSDTSKVVRVGTDNKVKAVADAKGTVVVSVVYTTPQGTKVVNQTVTVSDDALVAQSITSKSEEVEVAVSGTAVDMFAHADFKVTVKDQFDGTSLSDSSYVTFIVTNPDKSVDTVTNGQHAFDAAGTYSVTALTANGLTLDFTVKAE